jgi:hypothetical protein
MTYATEVPDSTAHVLDNIGEERERQFAKWGPQHHPDGTGRAGDNDNERLYKALCEARAKAGRVTWRDILLEETYESLAETSPGKLRKELVQVGAVAAAWIEDIDSRDAKLNAVYAAEQGGHDIGGEA